MKRRYIIQNIVNRLYWYGNYTNKTWTDIIEESKFYSLKGDAELKICEFTSDMYVVIEVWKMD